MITGLTEEQFRKLPSVSLHYPCDRCGAQRDYGNLLRSITDYSLVDCDITSKLLYTALYLCSGCHWQMTCTYQQLNREQRLQIQQIMKNEARWLQKVSRASIQDLADRVGVSRQAYHKWLRGKTITDEHKARLKELITAYMQEHEDDDEMLPYRLALSPESE